MRPIITENAALELSPEPAGRVLRSAASKPPAFSPRSRKAAATPRTRDLEEPNSVGRTSSWFRSTSKGSKPSD